MGTGDTPEWWLYVADVIRRVCGEWNDPIAKSIMLELAGDYEWRAEWLDYYSQTPDRVSIYEELTN